MLKSLRDDADYALQVALLGRKECSGARKAIDIADMRAGVLLADDYHYAEFDYVILGVNPVVNVLIASMLEKKGFNCIVSTNRMQDAWNYSLLLDLEFQKKIALRFRIGYRFLESYDILERTEVFLEDFFNSMNLKFPQSTYITNSDLVLSSNAKKWNDKYFFQAQIGQYFDNLPFNEPMFKGEPLYNKMYNIFYKEFSKRDNDWKYATDVKNQNQNLRLVSRLDDKGYYHILTPKVIITSHYHPYIKDDELVDGDVFKLIRADSLDDFNNWLD